MLNHKFPPLKLFLFVFKTLVFFEYFNLHTAFCNQLRRLHSLYLFARPSTDIPICAVPRFFQCAAPPCCPLKKMQNKNYFSL